MSEIETQSIDLLEAFFSSREESVVVDALEYLGINGAKLTADQQLEIVLFDQAFRSPSVALPSIEAYLAVCPALQAEPAKFVDIVYGDFRIRKARGEKPSAESLLQSFPDIAEELRKQIALSHWLDGALESLASASYAAAGDDTYATVPSIPRELPVNAISDPGAPLPYSDFEIGRRLGAGGMGEVYAAQQKSLQRDVAVKVIRRQFVDDAQIRGRFLREARVVGQLRHPHIAAVYGIGRTPEGGLFIAMEFVRGGSLENISAKNPLPVAEAVRITNIVGEAIAHAHSRGVVHRDLKPSNVLVEPDGRVVVVDFGLARFDLSGDPELSSPSQLLGTPQFLAPEQIDRSLGEPGTGVDIYGLGSLLYVLLTGKAPFPGGSVGEILKRAITEQAPSVLKLRPEAGPTLAEVCRRALSKRPEDRYASAEEFCRALTGASSGVPAATKPRPVVSRRMALTALAAVGVVAAASFFGLRSTTAAPPTVEWKLELYPQGKFDSRIALLENPRAAADGDGVRLQLRVSRPSYVYIFWIDSEGSWTRLYPAKDAVAVPVEQVELPAAAATVLPLVGSSRWDACVAVVRETPAPADFDFQQLLRAEGVPQVARQPILVDDRLYAISPNASTSNALAKAESRLGGTARAVDAPKGATFETPATFWKNWRATRSEAVGDVHYVVLARTRGA